MFVKCNAVKRIVGYKNISPIKELQVHVHYYGSRNVNKWNENRIIYSPSDIP